MPATLLTTQLLVSKLGLTLSAAERLHTLAPFLTPSVILNLGVGAYHLMVGLLLGTVKYAQIHSSKTATAHPYISTAHRASLMYGFASAQLAVFAGLSSWTERTNVGATVAAQTFFVSAVATYAIHGILRDTTNQLKAPHKLGERRQLPAWMVRGFMIALVIAEVGGCGVLTAGAFKTFYHILSTSSSFTM
ncbi:hypothetical protein EMPS_09136 [Entomortierella parvispora]|uniref:Uncharacterized protein n=1 Tax=Entomortierella parvispora TaxID=205924 RepID=A0A9P3M038_9FUNG|nr:hypothetical protein EMPS_09136 [Entomortierella parvispora]